MLVLISLTYSGCRQFESEDLEFKPQYENPHEMYLRQIAVLPRSGTVSPSQAFEYLNDGLNHLYCRPSDKFLETLAFTDTFTLAVNQYGQIEEDDLLDLMDTIAWFAGGHFYAESREEKDPLMFDIRPAGWSSASTLEVSATFYMEAGSPLEPEDEYPYEMSWGWCCSSCPTATYDYGSPDLFRRDLRKALVHRDKSKGTYLVSPYVVCFTPTSGYCGGFDIGPFDPDEVHDELINPNDPNPADNYFDYLLFYNYEGYDNFHLCLDTAEMNFYFRSMKDLAISVIPNQNWVIGQIEVGYDLLPIVDKAFYFHNIHVIRSRVYHAVSDQMPLPPYEP